MGLFLGIGSLWLLISLCQCSILKDLINYVKYCNVEEDSGSVEAELFHRYKVQFAEFVVTDFNMDFDSFVANQLRKYYHEQIRKCYMMNMEPSSIQWSSSSSKLLGYILFKHAYNTKAF